MPFYNDPKKPVLGNLPSHFRPDIGKVLVTGATGYIGGRLVSVLLERGYSVRVMVRVGSPEQKERWPGAEIMESDTLDMHKLEACLQGVDIVFYLIHSLSIGKMAFEMFDLKVAENFRIAAGKTNIRKIIYLSGLGNEDSKLSPHLDNRLKVGTELAKGKIPVTILRAAMIIGSGSASYEILKNLVLNTPIYLIPYWAKTRNQQIAVSDVLKYLVGVMEVDEATGKVYDIGGPDILSYEKMLKKLGAILGKRRLILPSFFSSTSLYGYFASLLTPVPAAITKCLMEGCKNDVVCQNKNIQEILPFKPLSFNEAILDAMTREEQDRIYTRWSDAYPPAHDLAIKITELKSPPRFQASYSILTNKPALSLYKYFCKIGGKEGWFYNNWLWRLRGVLDRILLGVGTSRGRRSSSELRINDVIDFWRVEDLIKEKQLLLRAEMKVPGKAWLEFRIQEENRMRKFTVSAYFQPSNWTGHVYWYNFLPFHVIIFKNLIKQINKKCPDN
ncbi:SDR family oxidoreductase [Bacteroidota bacterium]